VSRGGGRPKALLVNPPVYDFALYDLFLKPYGLLRAGMHLHNNGWDTAVVDALDYEDPASAAVIGRPRRKEDGTGKMFRAPASPPAGLESCGRRYSRYGILPESLERRIAAAGGGENGREFRPPDVILVGTGMTYWYPGAVEAVRLCRKVFPGVPVLAGGIYASLMPDHCSRATGADAVIAGDGGRGLAENLPRFGLPAPEGPFPAAPLPLPGVWKDAAVLRLNEGCPLSCDYCASRLLTPHFIAGDPAAAADLVRDFTARGIRNFAFYDDALLAGREKVFLPFLERVAGFRGGGTDPRFYLPNAVHIRGLDRVTAELMHRAGFREIRMGFESSSPDFHAAHTPGGAKFSPDSFPETVRILEEAGFSRKSLSVYILAGLPGQRAEETEISVRAALRERVTVRLSEYSPVPGTGLWEESVRLSRHPVAEEPLFHNNSFFPMEWEGFTRGDLQRLKNLARTGGDTPGGGGYLDQPVGEPL
jgi:hypothetical protein